MAVQPEWPSSGFEYTSTNIPVNGMVSGEVLVGLLALEERLLLPWRYTTHSGCVFYSPLSGL